jgi:hypothetical protein
VLQERGHHDRELAQQRPGEVRLDRTDATSAIVSVLPRGTSPRWRRPASSPAGNTVRTATTWHSAKSAFVLGTRKRRDYGSWIVRLRQCAAARTVLAAANDCSLITEREKAKAAIHGFPCGIAAFNGRGDRI